MYGTVPAGRWNFIFRVFFFQNGITGVTKQNIALQEHILPYLLEQP